MEYLGADGTRDYHVVFAVSRTYPFGSGLGVSEISCHHPDMCCPMAGTCGSHSGTGMPLFL